MTSFARLESPLGELLLTSSGQKLTGLYFADSPHARRADHTPEGAALAAPGNNSPLFAETLRQLEEYASGVRREFDLPIALAGTPFQLRVWREISLIPFGQTLTYGEIARRAGSPGADRAAGTAAGRNPLCWILPCHRVTGRDGSLTGYAGGLARKQTLLAFESARASGRPAPLDFRPAPFLIAA